MHLGTWELLDQSKKKNKLIFASIEIINPLPAPFHSVSWIRFKFRNQLQLLPQSQVRDHIREESSIINIDNNIGGKIIRKVINA